MQTITTPGTPMIITATTTIPGTPTTTTLVYVRSKHLKQIDLPQFSTATFTTEANGNQDVIYTQKDFGTIKTDADLATFLNGQLAKDTTRTPISAEAVAAQPSL